VRRLLRWTLLAALLGLLVLGWGFLRFLDGVDAAVDDPLRPTEAIIVLTGGGDRVETGLRLLEQGGRTAAAGFRHQRRADPGGTGARPWAGPAALAGKVTLGQAAATTLGNAAEVAAYARGRRISSLRLVTAGYHMPRALLELRRAAPGLVVVPHPVTPAALREPSGRGRGLPGLRRWTLLSGEYLKYVMAAAGLTRFLPAKETAPR
jgi:uncharacterized SAM-binding protein YcdF (DUF218 family)